MHSENNAAAFFAVHCNFVGCLANRDRWLRTMVSALSITGRGYKKRLFLKMQSIKYQRGCFPLCGPAPCPRALPPRCHRPVTSL